MSYTDPRTKNLIPDAKSPKDYLNRYAETIQQNLAKVEEEKLQKILDLLQKCIEENRRVYVGGNGGSAAIADHLLCDWVKGVALPNEKNLKVQSLLGSPALFTAIGNDYGYEHTLSYPLEIYGERGDLLVLISSSGNSANIAKAIEIAKEKGIAVIGLSGFDGGILHKMADVSIHIPIHNYGMVEDCHQSIMHVLAQYLFRLRSTK